MESSYYCKDMEDYVSVVDVYDSAALIGKDFEYLIEQYGVEAVTELMPKVIRVLEQLEFLAGKNEKENDELLQLELTIKRLSCEKEERNKERQKYEQELEQIEESYRKETKDLCQMVSNLQDQNRRLQSRLNEKSTGQEAAVEKTEEDFNVIQSLKETITKQRGQIKGLQSEAKHKDTEVESMHIRIERLAQDNDSLRSVSSSFQSETESLIKEQSRLQNTLREKDTQILNIRDAISQQEKDSCDDSQTSPTEKANIIGQVVGNVKDPDNPRFTLNELKDILTERNTLKSKLIEIEEELIYYKSKDKPSEDSDSWQVEQNLASNMDDSYIGDVQGPLPPEPWEKLHGKPESGIRKFFKLLGLKNEPVSNRSRKSGRAK